MAGRPLREGGEKMKDYIVVVEATNDGYNALKEVQADNPTEARKKAEGDDEWNVLNIIEGGKIVW
jgi:hypothetical protein